MPPFEVISQAAACIVPEIILLATVCIMFLVGPFLVDEQGRGHSGLRHRWGALSLLSLVTAAIAWLTQAPASVDIGPFRVDHLVWVVRGLTFAFGAMLVLITWNQIDDGRAAELQACLLAIIAGADLVALANDLVGLFLGLELVSISTYVLLYLPDRDRGMRESTLKYFLLSIFSSAILLYGISWLFGAAGTTSLPGIASAAAGGKFSVDALSVRLGLGLMIMGLAFRLTAVPFHFYAPDVFQGATSSAAAMLSFVPKLVGFAALLRVLPAAAGSLSLTAWAPTLPVQQLLAVIAVATMFGGNLLALRQQNIYRLLAYSSIAHAGYMLVGLTVGNSVAGVSGTSALLFYLTAYGLMTIGAFALIAATDTGEKPLREVPDLSGLSRSRPAVSLLLAFCLFSLTGLPPTAGFLGKVGLFMAAWSNGTVLGRVLAGALAVNTVIAAWYYLRLVAVIYLGAPSESRAPALQPASLIAGTLCSVCTLVLFVIPQGVWRALLAVVN